MQKGNVVLTRFTGKEWWRIKSRLEIKSPWLLGRRGSESLAAITGTEMIAEAIG